MELVPCHTICHFVSASAAVSVRLLPPPRPPGFPWLLLLASSAVRCCQLFSSLPLCHLVMKRSTASTIPRYQFPLFLAALGHIAQSLLRTVKKGSYPWTPCSVASDTLMMSSTRHWAQFFFDRPRPGFTPPAIVPNFTRWVSRSLVVRCTAPAKRRRRLRIGVSTLSHCAFFESLGVRHAVVGAPSALKTNDP